MHASECLFLDVKTFAAISSNGTAMCCSRHLDYQHKIDGKSENVKSEEIIYL